MRRRTLALTSASAVVAAMTVLPSIGAAAAEPLPTGSYTFQVDGTEVVVVVDEAGSATYAVPDGYTVVFQQDADGLVLDELTVTVTGGDGSTIEHAVAITVSDVDADQDGQLDYTVAVVADTGDDTTTGDDGTTGDGTTTDDGTTGDDTTGDGTTTDDGSVDETTTTDDGTEDGDDATEGDDEVGDEETAGSDHGAIVSTVAECAPRGREAREAGLPNHGFFVSAAARGETVTWTFVDPDTGEETQADADLTTLEGATAFCAAVTSDDGSVAAEDDADDSVDSDDSVESDDSVDSVGSDDDSVGSDDAVADDGAADSASSEERRGPPEGRGGDKARGANKGRGGPRG